MSEASVPHDRDSDPCLDLSAQLVSHQNPPTAIHVLLESYTMSFTAGPAPTDIPLHTIYKARIPLFHSLFTAS